jgi:hypothetical protein
MWPKKIGLKKHNKKTILPTFLLNNSLEILEIPKIVKIEKDQFIKCNVSISYFFGNIFVTKVDNV